MDKNINGGFHSTGSVKRIDAHGRIVIPQDVRAKLQLESDDALEILEGDNCILLRKYSPSGCCMLCHEMADTVSYNGNNLCRSCIEHFVEQLDSD